MVHEPDVSLQYTGRQFVLYTFKDLVIYSNFVSFQLKPPLSRYDRIWDVKLVLDLLTKISPAKKFSLQDLTLKTSMLFALVITQKQQTLHNLDITDMHIKRNCITFIITSLLKQSRPGNVGFNNELRSYPPDRRSCIYTYVIEHFDRTQVCRGKEKSLFVSYKKPHLKISKDTIARWLRKIKCLAGVDIKECKPHSV